MMSLFRHCEEPKSQKLEDRLSDAAIQTGRCLWPLDCRVASLLAMTRGLLRATQGATAIEFALVAPVLFLTLFGALEFGRLMWTQSALHYAVQQAARCASVNTATCGTASQTASYAASIISALNIPSSAFTVTLNSSCGQQVLASLNYQFVVTGLFPYTPTLTAKACFP